LLWCAEVRRLLSARGHLVAGPFFKSKWFGGRQWVIHEDIFNCFDLISFYQGEYLLHQVTDLPHRAEHQTKIDKQGLRGYLWCRTKVGGRVKYRVFLNGCELNE
jgi:hypothetical protein